jgi:hypothetical protein
MNQKYIISDTAISQENWQILVKSLKLTTYNLWLYFLGEDSCSEGT